MEGSKDIDFTMLKYLTLLPYITLLSYVGGN